MEYFKLCRGAVQWVVAAILSLVFSTVSCADETDLQARLQRMEQVIQQQQADLEAQKKQLAEQYELIRQLQLQAGKEAEAERTSPSILLTDTQPADDQVEQHAGREEPGPSGPAGLASQAEVPTPDGQQAAVAELARREQAGTAERQVNAQATLYDPSSTIFDPDFPGAWHLPGTTSAMKIGGYVNLSLTDSFDPLLSTDRFIVGSIPPKGVDVPGAREGTTVSASQTRLNFEVREQTSQGPLRAFVEGDFEGDGDTFRLRHAFGQYGSLLAGKTWSTFANIDALPEEVDFEGINGVVLQRQSQLRYFPRLGKDISMVFSLEDPRTDVQNGTGEQGYGDFVMSVDRLPLGGLGAWNYKVSVILRDLEGRMTADVPADAAATQSTTGWGITTSGRRSFSRWGDNDFLLWQLTYGEGIGRYLNDLNTIGGGDAVFDPEGNLRALPVFAGFLSYRHAWAGRPWFLKDLPGLLRSNFTVSWVDVDNYEFQDDGSYQSTWRASANLLYFPTQNVRVGAEFMWGERTNKDDSKGSATQLQLSARYDF